MERLGKSKSLNVQGALTSSTTKNRDCVVLFPTNGVGMGHFSRMFCLAKSIKKKSPRTEIVFFTTNYVLHPLYRAGFTAYHIPNRNKFEQMSPTIWNSQCEEIISNVISVHKPHTFIFDGAYPYRGMLNALAIKGEISKIWVRRLSKLKGEKTPIDAFDIFDKIVVPDDQIEPDVSMLESWPVKEINLIPPLLSVNRTGILPRGSLRMRLGIPSDALVALVILGAGSINDIHGLRSIVVEALVAEGAYVVVGDSMLNPEDPIFDDEKVRVIQDYPIMRNRRCFDIGVIAGGYNSVHEALLLKLPSLVIPNMQTKRDDQLTRALKAAETGGMLVVEEGDKELVKRCVKRLTQEEIREKLSQSLQEIEFEDGALTLADSIISSN